MLCVAYNSAVPLARVTKYAYEATAPEFRRVANIERWLSLHKHRKMCMKLVERGVSVDRLRELFEYRDGRVFRIKDSANGQESCKSGSRAGSNKPNGYRAIQVDSVQFSEHRLVYALVKGYWPVNNIDHANRNRADNHIENLRDVTYQGNQLNRSLSWNSQSKVLGVFWNTLKKKWQAQITCNRKQKHLGFFDSLEAAIAVRKAAEIEFGFHPNHGKELVTGNRAATTGVIK